LASIGSIGAGSTSPAAAVAAIAVGDAAVGAEGAEARRVAMCLPSLSMQPSLVVVRLAPRQFSV